jgi:hypothetical protein
MRVRQLPLLIPALATRLHFSGYAQAPAMEQSIVSVAITG